MEKVIIKNTDFEMSFFSANFQGCTIKMALETVFSHKDLKNCVTTKKKLCNKNRRGRDLGPSKKNWVVYTDAKNHGGPRLEESEGMVYRKCRGWLGQLTHIWPRLLETTSSPSDKCSRAWMNWIGLTVVSRGTGVQVTKDEETYAWSWHWLSSLLAAQQEGESVIAVEVAAWLWNSQGLTESPCKSLIRKRLSVALELHILTCVYIDVTYR